MKFLKKIFGLPFTREQESITNPMDSSSLDEKYSGMENEELYQLLKAKELNDEVLTDEEKEFLDVEYYAHIDLGEQLNKEFLNGRSLAIKELMTNTYQMLRYESSNPMKELINFTIDYYKKYFSKQPNEAEVQLVQSFPIMHPYIRRLILDQQKEIITDSNFDVQNGFDEFLIFCMTIFCALYPDKNIRDEQIRKTFKIMSNDLIRFIDDEKKTI